MSRWWLPIFVFIACPVSAFEPIDYATLFPAVIQGHHNDGATSDCSTNGANSKFTINQGSEVNGTGGVKLNYCGATINGNNHCDIGNGSRANCVISRKDIDGLELTSNDNQFLTSSDGNGINYDNCSNIGVLGSDGKNNFGSLGFNASHCSLNFSGRNSVYYIRSLTLNGTTLNLPAGDYWIESLTLNGDASTVNISGDVRLFVKNGLNINGGMKFNPNGESALTLVSYSSVTFNGGQSVFNGYIYSNDSITLDSGVVINGRVSSHNLTMNSGSKINDAKYGDISTVPACNDVFTEPPSGNHSPYGLYPPSTLGPLLGDLTCNESSPCSFTPGDYNYRDGVFTEHGNKGNIVTSSGATTRLYFDNLSLKTTDINLSDGSEGEKHPENIIIYVRHNLDIQGDSNVDAIVYLAEGATVNGSFKLTGHIAAGAALTIEGGSIVVNSTYVNKADFGGMCTNSSVSTDTINHFQLEFSTSPTVCAPENITVLACENSDCSSLYTGSITASMSPESVTHGQWLGDNQLQFSQGKATIALQKNDAEPITIGISDSTPIATNPYICNDNASCSLAFAEAGFIFDVPDKLAGRPANVLIKAVKKDPQSQQCVSAFASTKKVLSFWSDFNSPMLQINGVYQRMQLDSTGIAHSQTEALSNVKYSRTVDFNARGEATIAVNYADAGKLTLNAQYIGSGDDVGLNMTGSDSFVSFPAGLCVSPVESAAQCLSRNSSCNGYRAAGDTFPVNIVAKQWQSDGDGNICDNGDTPSFAMPAVKISHELVAPVNGQIGALAVTSFEQHASVTGTNINEAISEVGVFTLAASTTREQVYLGSQAFAIPAYNSVAIGRIYPASFLADNVNFPPSCGSFSYIAQPVHFMMTLKALNRAGTLTQNYFGDFGGGIPQLVAENNNNGHDLTGRLSTINEVSWKNGQMPFTAVNNSSFQFNRAIAPSVDGPFSALALGIKVNDRDNVTMLLANMLSSLANDCVVDGNCDAQQLTTMDIRLGRAALANSYGPENQPVLMNGQSQYWNGTQWQLNSDDSCSVVTPAMQTQQTNPVLGYSFEPSLTNGQQVIRTGAPAAVSNGQFGLSWLANGTYQGKVTAPVIVPDYLKWYWQFDRAAEVLQDPRASAYFGRYRGNDRIINWRERR